MRVSDVREIFQEYELTQIPVRARLHPRRRERARRDPLGDRLGARSWASARSQTIDGVAPPAIVVSNDEVVTALVVDEIGDIAEVPDGAIEPPISIIDRSQAEFVSGSVFIDGSMVGLISIERMLEPVVVGRH